jgi:hypothetical protein
MQFLLIIPSIRSIPAAFGAPSAAAPQPSFLQQGTLAFNVTATWPHPGTPQADVWPCEARGAATTHTRVAAVWMPANGAQGMSHVAEMVQRLRCCRGLENITEKDLREMASAVVERVFVMLFLRIGVKALRDCVEERGADRRPKSTSERRRTEENFQHVFVRLVEKHLAEAGYNNPLGTADLLHNRREFNAAVEFLLDTQSSATEEWAPGVPSHLPAPSLPAAAAAAEGGRGGGYYQGNGADAAAASSSALTAAQRRRQLVGSCRVGNPRLVGGEGHRPMLRGSGERAERRGKKPLPEDEWLYASDPPTDAARQVRYMQTDMARLKKENRALRLERTDMETIYQQLVSEQRHEKFDQRRLNLLKAQNLQLERQLAMLDNTLRQRNRVSRQMEQLLDDLALYLADPEDPAPSAPPARSLGEAQTARLHALVRRAREELEEQGSLDWPVRAPRQQYYYSRPAAATPPPSTGGTGGGGGGRSGGGRSASMERREAQRVSARASGPYDGGGGGGLAHAVDPPPPPQQQPSPSTPPGGFARHRQMRRRRSFVRDPRGAGAGAGRSANPIFVPDLVYVTLSEGPLLPPPSPEGGGQATGRPATAGGSAIDPAEAEAEAEAEALAEEGYIGRGEVLRHIDVGAVASLEASLGQLAPLLVALRHGCAQLTGPRPTDKNAR